MQKWTLTYAVNDGSGMFGLEPARQHTLEVELATDGMARTGEDEQRILEMMRAAVRDVAGEDAIVTDAQEVAD